MARDANQPGTGNQGGGFVVRGPRPTDAVGASLRHAYDRNHRLPADLATMLAALDTVGYRPPAAGRISDRG